MRQLLHMLALKLATPVYRLETEMPAHELRDWILYFQAERRAQEPQSVDEIGPEAFAAAMGADVGGMDHGSESGPTANST